jgi:hypothetical protein
MGIEKSVEIAAAKKRRAKLLKDFKRLQGTKAGMTISKFADKHCVTRQRMGQLLNMAEADIAVKGE